MPVTEPVIVSKARVTRTITACLGKRLEGNAVVGDFFTVSRGTVVLMTDVKGDKPRVHALSIPHQPELPLGAYRRP